MLVSGYGSQSETLLQTLVPGQYSSPQQQRLSARSPEYNDLHTIHSFFFPSTKLHSDNYHQLVLLIHDPLGSFLGLLLLLLRGQILLRPLGDTEGSVGSWSVLDPVEPSCEEG